MDELDELKDKYEKLKTLSIRENQELLDKYEKLKSKYNQAKSGNLLSFQEVEIQDLQQENEELKQALEGAADQVDQLLRESEDKMLSGGNKGIDEFVQKTFVKTWNNSEPSTLHIDGHKFTLIPHNCDQLKGR
jgi:predicted nuclease with TOPRIM domain